MSTRNLGILELLAHQHSFFNYVTRFITINFPLQPVETATVPIFTLMS
ncbi:MAG: hypothetical protein AAF609_06980 [Cyanobacteria bacterium P01_C01_bin.120]